MRDSNTRRLRFGRYDYAGFSAFIAYAMCSLSIPLALVAMGNDLDFPLDRGGMTAGGSLHLMRSIAVVAALLCCGGIAGRIGKRKSLGASMLLTGLGILLCAVSPVYFWLLPGLVLAGFGEGICEGIATPFVQDLHSDAPERYVNIAHSFWSVGIGACVLVSGGLLVSGVSWRVVLGLCGALAVFSALMFLWRENPRKKYPEHPQQISPREIWQFSAAIARTPRFWVYSLGMFMGAGAEFCLTFWSAAYLELRFGVGVWHASLGTGAIALGMFAGRSVFGYYASKRYLKHLLLATGLGTIPITLALGLLTPENFSSQAALFGCLYTLLFLAGIGIAPYWPTLQVYGVENLPKLDSTMLYIYFSAMGIPGCGFFTWLMGFMGDRMGLKGAFLLVPASLVLFSLLIFLEGWVFPYRGKRRSDAPAGAEQ